MTKDYSEELKELIEKFKDRGFRYAKPIDILLERINDTKENIEKELIDLNGLIFCSKQERSGEIRYILYYIYSNRKGRIYAITFQDKIVIITIFPVGKKTLKKYKRKFIS
ncbi:MAG: hypothetical protein AABW83_01255 [Nanoarchaeota archaeon]